jgi:hypothetical protein
MECSIEGSRSDFDNKKGSEEEIEAKKKLKQNMMKKKRGFFGKKFEAT